MRSFRGLLIGAVVTLSFPLACGGNARSSRTSALDDGGADGGGPSSASGRTGSGGGLPASGGRRGAGGTPASGGVSSAGGAAPASGGWIAEVDSGLSDASLDGAEDATTPMDAAGTGGSTGGTAGTGGASSDGGARGDGGADESGGASATGGAGAGGGCPAYGGSPSTQCLAIDGIEQLSGINLDEGEAPFPTDLYDPYIGRGAMSRVRFHATRTTWLVARLNTPKNVQAQCPQGGEPDFVVLYAVVRDAGGNAVTTLRLADNEGETVGGRWEGGIQVPVCAGSWMVDFYAESAHCGTTWPVSSTGVKTVPFQLGDWCLNEK